MQLEESNSILEVCQMHQCKAVGVLVTLDFIFKGLYKVLLPFFKTNLVKSWIFPNLMESKSKLLESTDVGQFICLKAT